MPQKAAKPTKEGAHAQISSPEGGLEEGVVLVLAHVLGRAHPQRLVVVLHPPLLRLLPLRLHHCREIGSSNRKRVVKKGFLQSQKVVICCRSAPSTPAPPSTRFSLLQKKEACHKAAGGDRSQHRSSSRSCGTHPNQSSNKWETTADHSPGATFSASFPSSAAFLSASSCAFAVASSSTTCHCIHRVWGAK